MAYLSSIRITESDMGVPANENEQVSIFLFLDLVIVCIRLALLEGAEDNDIAI